MGFLGPNLLGTSVINSLNVSHQFIFPFGLKIDSVLTLLLFSQPLVYL